MINRLLLGIVFAALACSMASSTTVNDLRPFVRGSWKEIRKAHTGRPTVVHFWGVTCGPCRTEMPHWGALLRERSDLNLVLINSDLVPNEPRSVVTMLTNAGLASAENWIFDDSFVERLRFEIDPRWHGEIPVTLLIAHDGTIKTISGVADLNEIRTWLDHQKQATR